MSDNSDVEKSNHVVPNFQINTVASWLRKTASAQSRPLAVVAWLLLWQLASSFAPVSAVFLPSPFEVAVRFLDILRNGYAGQSYFSHVFASVARIAVAAFIAIPTAVLAGIAMSSDLRLKNFLDVPIGFYWPLPPLSYLPLMIIWLGIGEASKITLLALAMFAPVCLATQAGIRAIPQELKNLSRSLGGNSLQILRHILIPGALPEILTGIRVAIGIGWGTLVAAELIAATQGVGYMTLAASHFMATDVVFVGIFTIATLAWLFSFVLRKAEQILVPWKGKL